MKRTIHLYIGGVEADLGDQSFLLFNWAFTDVTEIAQIKNGYTCPVTLPGTRTNDGIFGQMERNDRVTVFDVPTTGIYFDPSRRTPFTIYDDAGGILESGYLKLDGVDTEGARHSYRVVLYGGLGSFLYSLAYDSNGDKRTLADLKYHKHMSVVQEDLSFTISASTVKAAWDRLAIMNVYGWPSDKWEIINFAPAYNGYPRGYFDANKGIYPVGGFLPDNVDGCTPPNGGTDTVVTLPSKKTEWETRDLRSYLQRPVLRVAAFVDAICYPGNNGGFTVDLSDAHLSPADDTTQGGWITLPLLQDLDLQIEGQRGTFAAASGTSKTYAVPSSGGAPTQYVINVTPHIATGVVAPQWYLDCWEQDPPYTAHFVNWIEVQVTFRQSGILVRQEVYRFSSGQVLNDIMPLGGRITHIGTFDGNGDWTGPPLQVSWLDEGNDIYDQVDISVTADGTIEGHPSWPSMPGEAWSDESDMNSDAPFTYSADFSGWYGNSLPSSARSFLTVTQDKLLATNYTPADYLLSLCKRTNHRLQFDPVTNTVKIIHIDQYWQGTTLNIDKRINRSKPIVKTPLQFSARWYEWREKYDHGEWAQYYANVYGRTYGAQRVNTGYEFDANTLEVVDSVLFRGAVQILESSQYYVDAAVNGIGIPAAFLDAGATYLLTKDDGSAVNAPIPAVDDAVITYINTTYPYFDLFDKVQFHDADNAAYDERDTILYFGGTMQDVTGLWYILTDDTSRMMTLNNGKPCWHLARPVTGVSVALTEIPQFSRMDGDRLLDWGVPAEIPVPGLNYADLYGEYEVNWQTFITKQFSVDNPVLRCFVNWSGMQVGPDLLRRNYEFDGARWHLNKIINYSLTTWDDTECEFIKYTV